MSYTVVNNTDRVIWWQDGLWTSGNIDPGATHEVPSDHDANVTIHAKSADGDIEFGNAWIPKDGSLSVFGKWHWDVRPTGM